VNISHPDLVGSIWQNPGEVAGDGIDNDNNGLVDDYNGYDFVEKSPNLQPHGDHGTLVSGVIAATANNRMGIAGIAPEAKIMPLTVCESKTCSGQAVIDAIRYAVDNGADIINLSLTGLGDNPTFDATFDASMWYAHDHGVIVVVAAGNGNQSLSKAQKFYGRNFNMSPISPVCNDGTGNWVIGVASLDNSSLNSVFSDYGSNCIDISAYGEGVFSTGVKEFSDDNSEYDSAYGTSFATPQISGALALAISQFPGKSMTDIKSALIKSGTNIDPNLALEFKGHFGKALNILSFLDMLAITETTPTTPTSNPANPSNDTSSSTTNPNSQTGFSDLGAIHRSYTAITYLTNKNILEGYPDGTFKPSATVNRAELLKILVAGQDIDPDPIRYRNCFPDVKEEWFARYVCYAKSQGWVEGYDDGTFRPAETVNKVEALKMMIEGLDITFSEDYTARFADTPSNAWFAPYVALAQHLNLLEERGALFNPASDRTRSSISENLYRLLQIRERGLESYEG
jgi:subtilisin family serine protease